MVNRMNRFIIVADGKYKDVYYTGNKKKFWSNNLRMAKIYHDYHECYDKANTFIYNNPRVAKIEIKEL